MIVTDSLVFLHLHKSGGTFINQLLLTCEPSAQRIGYHLPYSELPEAYRHLPVVGTVRNPWAYYVSWYHFQKNMVRPNALFLINSEEGRLDFDATIRNLLTLHENEARVEQLAQAFPEGFVAHGLNVTRACIRTILGSSNGFYSFLHDRLYAGAPSPVVLKSETLRDGFRPFVRQPLGHRFLDEAPDMNTSRHAPYRDYYSADLRQAVEKADQALIAAYGYAF